MPRLLRARRQEDELELAFREWDAHQVLGLVDAWGLARDRQSSGDDVRPDEFDSDHVRTVADVWARAGRGADESG